MQINDDPLTIERAYVKRLTAALIGFAFMILAVFVWFCITNWLPPVVSWVFILPFLCALCVSMMLSFVSLYKCLLFIKANRSIKTFVALLLSLSSIAIGAALLF
jgi:ABC-type polysaccharide/polyol phosphate export permease